MWGYSEAAIEPSPYKTIVFHFLTTTCKSYFLVKLQDLIIHVGTWRRFDEDTTSMQLHTDFLSTLKRLCTSKGMQVYKTINSVKTSFLGFLGFWAMVQSMDHVKKVLAYTWFVFCILYNAFQTMPLVNTNKKILKVLDSSSWVLQCTAW